MTKERARKITIYSFDKKTREVTMIQTLKTTPVSDKRLKEIVKAEMLKGCNKHAAWQVSE